MKIHYDKKGLLLLITVFIAFTIINIQVFQIPSIIEGIGYTIGVSIVYFIILLFSLIRNYLKTKEYYFFTNWKASALIIFFHFGSLYPELKSLYVEFENSFVSKTLSDESTETILKKTFKNYLKENDISMDIKDGNIYETIQPGNKYSNHYFNVATDFPDTWEIDRGMSEHAIFRAFNADSALSIHISAVPIDFSSFNNPEKSLLEKMNSISNGNYKMFLLNEIKKNVPGNISEFEVNEEIIRSRKFIVTSYTYEEQYDNYIIPGYSKSYSTSVGNVLYTIGYTCPKVFFNQRMIDQVLDRTNFLDIN